MLVDETKEEGDILYILVVIGLEMSSFVPACARHHQRLGLAF